jgi:hypothetical protein
MLGHRGGEVAVVAGRQIDGAKCEGHSIGFDRHSRRGLLREGGNRVMVMPAVGQDRGHEPKAHKQKAEGLSHTTSQEKVDNEKKSNKITVQTGGMN